jgi:hypothetical protein
LTYRPARLHRLAESIPGILKYHCGKIKLTTNQTQALWEYDPNKGRIQAIQVPNTAEKSEATFLDDLGGEKSSPGTE